MAKKEGENNKSQPDTDLSKQAAPTLVPNTSQFLSTTFLTSAATTSARPYSGAELRAAPEPSFWNDLRSAYAFNNKPIDVLDDAIGRLSETAFYKLRNILPEGMEEGLASGTQGVVEMAGFAYDYARNGFESLPGDQQNGPGMYKAVEDFFNTRGKPNGQFDMRMAVGWQPDGPIIYNGKMMNTDESNKLPPINNMLAIYVKHADGKVEIIDPSTKVQSLWGIAKIPATLIPEDDNDKRWLEYGGNNIIGQVLPMLAGGGFSVTAKGTASLSNVVAGGSKVSRAFSAASHGVEVAEITGARLRLLQTLDTSTTALKLSGRTAYFLGALNGVAGITPLVNMVQEIGLKEDAAKEISDAFKDPNAISADAMRKSVNDILKDYSYKEGSMSTQIYIASVKDHEDPWSRVDDLSRRRVFGERRATTPWDEPEKRYRMVDQSLKTNLEGDLEFNRSFYKIADKIFHGQPVTDKEILTARFGLNMYAPESETEAKFLNIAGEKFTKDNIEYTDQERQETVDRMRKHMIPVMAYANSLDEAKTLKLQENGWDIDDIHARATSAAIKAEAQPPENTPLHELGAFTSKVVNQLEKDIVARDQAAELQRIKETNGYAMSKIGYVPGVMEPPL